MSDDIVGEAWYETAPHIACTVQTFAEIENDPSK